MKKALERLNPGFENPMIIGGDFNTEGHELNVFEKNSPLSYLKRVNLNNFNNLAFSKDFRFDGSKTIDESFVSNDIFVSEKWL